MVMIVVSPLVVMIVAVELSRVGQEILLGIGVLDDKNRNISLCLCKPVVVL